MCIKLDEAAALPWAVEKQACSRLYMLLDNMGSIVVANLPLEDAELICRAVNSHAALIEALEKIYSSHHNVDTERLTMHCECFACSIARAALAAENGEEA